MTRRTIKQLLPAPGGDVVTEQQRQERLSRLRAVQAEIRVELAACDRDRAGLLAECPVEAVA